MAADALARTREGARLLARVIRSPGPPALRQAAVYGFVFVRPSPALLVLLRQVFANPREDPEVRGQAAEALSARYKHRWQRRHQRLVEALTRGLEDPAPEVRFWSIFSLAHPWNRWVIPKLQVIAATDTATCPGMWTLRQEALWAIRWIEEQDLDLDPRTL